MAKSSKSMEIGARRFYPPHGVVALVSIEDREFHGAREEFHVLELTRGGTLLVPTASLSKTPFRPLISATKAKELLKRIRSKAKSKAKTAAMDAKERAALYGEQLKAGEADEYTEILRDLMIRAATDKISAGEQRLLEAARAYFIDEVGSVLSIDASKLLADVNAALAPQEEPEEPDEEDEN